jgi:hypothetical protein
MKKRIFTLLCTILSSVVMAQNIDSLELDSYFKQGQKNFEHIKAMDSLNTIVNGLQKEIKKKDRRIENYEYDAKNVKANLKLYSFLLKIEKNGLRNLRNDTSEYFKMEDGFKKLMLKRDVNLETLAELVGKNELERQLPKVIGNIEKGIIKIGGGVVLPPAPLPVIPPSPPSPPSPPPPVTGPSGFTLPDWPINSSISLPNEQLDIIYSKQVNYIIWFCRKYVCGAKFFDLYRKKQSSFQIPLQLEQLVINQILFKNFLNYKCPQ